MAYYEQQTTQQEKEQTIAIQDGIDESYKFNKWKRPHTQKKAILYDSTYELKVAEAELSP